MKQKWYLKTWFICILFAFWFAYGIPLIIGIILLFLKLRDEKKLTSSNTILQAQLDTANARIAELGCTNYEETKAKIADMMADCNQRVEHSEKVLNDTNQSIAENNTILARLTEEIESLKNSSEKLEKQFSTQQRKLARIRELYKSIEYSITAFHSGNIDADLLNDTNEKDLDIYAPSIIIKLHCMDVRDLRKAYRENDKQIDTVLQSYSSRYTTKSNQAIYKLMVIALRAELQNILYNLKYEKLDQSIENVKKVSVKYLQIAGEGNQNIAGTLTKFIGEIEYLFINAVKIEYNYYVKKEQAKQEQMAIHEQMRQEAEERKALEAERKRVEKEEAKFQSEIEKLQETLKTVAVSETAALQARILELQAQLSDVVLKKEEISNLQNGKAGNVYIISNLGSFGDDVFKIGMTRRLDPQDRINELGSASVPFKFDVHSFIFSDDAVALENKLHEMLNAKRLNKVNLRKEFFRISIDELESLVSEIDPTAEFNRTMLAEEFRQSISTDEVYSSSFSLDEDDVDED